MTAEGIEVIRFCFSSSEKGSGFVHVAKSLLSEVGVGGEGFAFSTLPLSTFFQVFSGDFSFALGVGAATSIDFSFPLPLSDFLLLLLSVGVVRAWGVDVVGSGAEEAVTAILLICRLMLSMT